MVGAGGTGSGTGWDFCRTEGRRAGRSALIDLRIPACYMSTII